MSDKPLTDITFSSFDLHPALLAGLEAAGFTRCTPIQAMTLPVALAGRDVAGQAQTGTGKTLAFLVTVVNRLMTKPALADRKPEDPRALILAPTRELAIQIHKDAVKFGSDLGLRFALVYGGVDYDKQREILQQGADVIIATPGRLIDYVKQHKVVSLHACEICVLDEADRMFDLGFIKDIRFLLRRMPERTTRQTLLFCATLSHRVLELAYEHMNEPEKLVVETESITAARVRQRIYFPADEEKIPLLIGLLSRSEGARTMVFVNTKAFVERVARALEKAGYRVGVLSRRRAAEEARDAAQEIPGRPARNCWSPPMSPPAACTSTASSPRLQLRPAVRCRRLRAPHRPYRAPGRGRRCDQLRLRALRDGPAGHRGLHRAEDPGRTGHQRNPDLAAARTPRRPAGEAEPRKARASARSSAKHAKRVPPKKPASWRWSSSPRSQWRASAAWPVPASAARRATAVPPASRAVEGAGRAWKATAAGRRRATATCRSAAMATSPPQRRRRRGGKPAVEGERAPRKRRRRRHGRPRRRRRGPPASEAR